MGKLRGRQKRPPAQTWTHAEAYTRHDRHLIRRLQEVHGITFQDNLEQTWDATLIELQRQLEEHRQQHVAEKRHHWRTELLQPAAAIRMINYNPQSNLFAVSDGKKTVAIPEAMDDVIIEQSMLTAHHDAVHTLAEAAMKGARHAPECKLPALQAQGFRD